MFAATRFLESCALLGLLSLLALASAFGGAVPIDNSTGSFAAAQGNRLYSVDFDTGKAILIYTDTTVSNQGINSVGMDTVKGIFYYVDNNSVGTNKAIFGYDTHTGERFVLTPDVTAYGVTLPSSAGLGGAGGEFANGSYYFSTEGGGANSSDQFYRVVFDPASNGRTISSITLVGIDNFQGATEFGDFLIDESTQRIYVANSGVGVDSYQINSGSLTYITRVANASVRQAARDRNNVLYMAGATFFSFDPVAGTFGTPKTITTDGTTALGNLYDAAAYLPAESSIGGHAFYDDNTNGTDDSEPGVGGLTVELFNDLNGNGTIDSGEKLLATTTTATDGSYVFGQLLPGDYIVRISDPNNVLNGGTSTTGGLTQTEAVRFVGSAALSHDFGFQDNRPTLAVGNTSATEGTNQYAVFTLSLSQTYTAPITVSLALADGTATSADYGPGLEVSTNGGSTWTSATTATFASGSTTVLARTPIVDDTLHENSETFTLTATVTSGVTKNTSATGTGTIIDNDPLPSFSINNVTRNEKAGSATFTVTLSAASGVAATVNYATADGTATAGSDYTATSGTLTFAPGVTTQTITVPILDDTIYEGSETYNVALSNSTSATIATGTGVGTIRDDGTGGGGTDDDQPTLSVGNVTATEGTDAYAVFPVSLSNASSQPTSFNFILTTGTASSADFGPGLEVSNNGTTWTSATSGTIAAGATILYVRTPIIDDTLHENTETFTLTATTSAGTTKNPSATGTGTIIDNDPPPTLSINNVTRNEKAGSATFTVTLSTASGLPASVDFATADGTAKAGSDYTATSGTLNFPAGTVTQTITVPILDDSIYEGSETFNVVLSNPAGSAIATGIGVGTILDDGSGGGGTDDDRPTLSVGNITVTEGTDAYAVFTVSLSNQSVQDTSFNFALATGTASTADFGPGLEVSTNSGTTWTSATSGTIAAGATTLLVRTPIIDDTLNEPTETFTLTATTTAGMTKNPSATGTCSILDNDPLPSFSINDVTVNENAGTAVFAVTLSTASGQTVTVNYATADGTATAGSDYTSTSGALTFAPGTVTRSIAVPIIDDSTPEPTETFNLNLSGATNATISHATGVGTILDDDATPNHPPVANNDIATTAEKTPVDIPVLANDTDPDHDSLTVTMVTVPPAQGTVSINPDNTVHYTPASNFTGPATISYSISDGHGGTASATVAVTVSPVNNAPTATDNTATTPEGRAIAVDVLSNDSDPDNDPLTVTSATVLSGRGTVAVNTDNTVEFTPADGFTGLATVIYTISDGHGGTASAIVRIQVDGLPVATDDHAVTTMNTAKTIAVLGNDRDPEGLPLTIVSTSLLASQGTFSITGGNQILFTPANGVVGTVRGQYTIRDQAGNLATANVTIDISSTAAPEPPVAVSDSAATTKQTPVTISVLQNDSDPDGGALTIISATVPSAQGSVTINSDGTLTFTAAAGFTGTANITYSISNPAGAPATAPALVQVSGGNNPPLARPDFATAATATAKVLHPLVNDTDPDGDTLTLVSATVPPAQGTVQVNPDGTITFTSAAGFTGTATVSYQISDGHGASSNSTVTITVSATPVNQPPVAANDTATTKVNQAVDIPVLANDRDPDGDPLTITSIGVPAGQGTAALNPDGTIHYVPVADFNGDVTFTYMVSDGQGGTATAMVTVNINDTPAAAADRVQTPPGTPVTIAVLGNDTDPNDNTLTLVSASVDPSEGTVVLNGNGTLTFTPAAGFHGTAEVPYTNSDGHGGFAQSMAFITVDNPPTPMDDTASTPLGQPVIIAVLTNDSDPDGDPLTVIGATVDPSEGTVEANPDGTITFTPSSTFTGPAVITYTVSDPSGAQASAQATVTRSDAPPVAETRKVYTYCATALYINALRTATDADGDPLTIISVSKPRHGKATIMPNGVIYYKPNMNYTASTTDTIVVTLSDGRGGTTTETISVHAFAAIAGTFQGLLTNTMPPAGGGAPTQRGRVTLTMNSRASVTANVQLDGSTYRLVGTLQGALTFTKQITFDGEAVTLSLVYDDLADTWTASLNGATNSILQDGSGIDRRATAARHATTQKVLLVPQSGAGPNGTARIKVSASGSITVTGVLPNGTPFSSGAFLNKPDSTAAIYHWLPAMADNVVGPIQVPNTAPFTPTGTLQWNDDPAGATAGQLLDFATP